MTRPSGENRQRDLTGAAGDGAAARRDANGEPRPRGAAPRPATDAFLRALGRLIMTTLFREVEIVAPERFPETGPVIVIANHGNSLVDGGMLLSYLPRIPRFLAASTVWDYAMVAPFMTASGAVRVFRRQDGRQDEGSLADVFAEAAGLLAEGGVLAVFPEGLSNNAPSMLPFKSGTARIALQAETAHGPLNVQIVPVSLTYEAKSRFRSRALVEFAEAMTPGPDAGAFAAADTASRTAAIRALTARLRDGLAAVAPDADSAGDARALTLAAEIAARPGANAAPPRLAGFAAARRRLRSGLARLGTTAPQQAHTARRALATYARLLAAAGLTDAQTGASPQVDTARSIADAAFGLPVVALALVFNGVPAIAVWAVSRRKARDLRLTWVAFGGLLLLPLTWLAWGLGAGLAGGGWIGGGAALIAGPLTGLLALPVIDRAAALWWTLRARRLLGRHPGLRDRLRTRRAAALAAVAALEEAAGRAD